jgi:hypothetical protein
VALSIPKKLFSRLFVHRLSTVPLAELFELDFTHHQLLILGGPVVYALALVALQFYESILRHIDSHSPQAVICTALYPTNA